MLSDAAHRFRVVAEAKKPVMVFKFPDQETGTKFTDLCIVKLGCTAGWPTFDGTTQVVLGARADRAKLIAKAKTMGGVFLDKTGIKIKGGTGRSGYTKYQLKETVQRFRTEATTSGMVGPHMTGLVVRPRRKLKCKRYDPKCRDAEWEAQAPIGGVAMLRRT